MEADDKTDESSMNSIIDVINWCLLFLLLLLLMR